MKKIKDIDNGKVCLDLSHNPPAHIHLPPGTYEHTCSTCKKITIVNIPKLIV